LERQRFIDSMLLWEARINRADLIKAFAISPAQAALDFRAYLKRAGSGVAYDTRAKSYVTTDDFAPVFPLSDGRQGLLDLAASGDPFATVLPRLERPIDVTTAARVRRAARATHRLLIDYQSFTKPKPSRRWITPARLISDGERWHARAWCGERLAWRDFVLARITAIHGEEPAADVPRDKDWEETLELCLTPAPHLSPSQCLSVERELAMKEGRLVLRLPRAMLFYARRRWGLDQHESRVIANVISVKD